MGRLKFFTPTGTCTCRAKLSNTHTRWKLWEMIQTQEMMTYFAMFKEIHLLRVHVLVHVRSRTPNLYIISCVSILWRTELVKCLSCCYVKTVIKKNIAECCFFSKGGTNTSFGLKFVRDNSFKPQNGARTNATKIVIVITDGQSADSAATKHEAQLLHHQGVLVYAVGVGSDVS